MISWQFWSKLNTVSLQDTQWDSHQHLLCFNELFSTICIRVYYFDFTFFIINFCYHCLRFYLRLDWRCMSFKHGSIPFM